MVHLLVVFKAILCSAYDVTLDDVGDVRGWTFAGNYNYSSTLIDGGNLAPNFEKGTLPEIANGVWYFAHKEQQPSSSGDLVNYGEIKFRLTHHLMAEVIVRLSAYPSVVVEMHGSRGKLLQKFRSTGKGWCDASYDVWKNLGAEVRYLEYLLKNSVK